jgi:hypothetical protein
MRGALPPLQRWVTVWMIEGFESRQRVGIYLFATASRTALGPTQTIIQWVPGSLSLGVKRLGREADHSPPSSAESRMRGAIPPFPNTPSRGTLPSPLQSYY